MAYVSQEKKASLAPTIKAILKKYNVKGTLSVRSHSSLVLSIKSGKMDFVENFIQTDASTRHGNKMDQKQIDYIRAKKCLDVNTYWCHEHFSGTAKKFLEEMVAAMEGPDFFNHDDSQSDYFSRSHYIDINIGQWDKPYTVEQ